MLRRAALHTWRYFAEFSTEEHNWLIPDNVQEEPLAIAPRISPTNLGFLFNARQVACEFGYLTIPEFAQQTLRTLATVAKLQRYRGHLLNWYDTRSLTPLEPQIVSAVDSGNLVASLWTLQQGCLDLLERPLLQTSALEGFLDHLRVLVDVRALPRKRFSAFQKEIKRKKWLQYLLSGADTIVDQVHLQSPKSKHSKDAQWFSEELHSRLENISQTVSSMLPGCCRSLLRCGTTPPSIRILRVIFLRSNECLISLMHFLFACGRLSVRTTSSEFLLSTP